MSGIVDELTKHRDAVVAWMAEERKAAGVDFNDNRYLSDLWNMASPCHASPVMPQRSANPPGLNWYDKFDMRCRLCNGITPASRT